MTLDIKKNRRNLLSFSDTFKIYFQIQYPQIQRGERFLDASNRCVFLNQFMSHMTMQFILIKEAIKI